MRPNSVGRRKAGKLGAQAWCSERVQSEGPDILVFRGHQEVSRYHLSKYRMILVIHYHKVCISFILYLILHLSKILSFGLYFVNIHSINFMTRRIYFPFSWSWHFSPAFLVQFRVTDTFKTNQNTEIFIFYYDTNCSPRVY